MHEIKMDARSSQAFIQKYMLMRHVIYQDRGVGAPSHSFFLVQ
uniref:Uncharacterized protein n=1 Tax=Anguilla anguilla TaxID=7936 RepID=A0A0E9XJ61_ANGAN